MDSLILVGDPVTELPSALLHGSPPELAETAVKVGTTANASSVGDGTGVSVGMGVGTGVLVGGTGVLAGIAAWVSATMVNAAATAVDWISCGLTVGSAGVPPPHALMTIAMAVMTETRIIRFILIVFS
ncbi:MAG: hypothetical protein MZV70_21630 [Desulfobacterales bacterium]|nr:hypothetical protein [Desulfobacterales bacterium]